MTKNNKIIAKREANEQESLLKQEISIMSGPLPSPEDLEKYEKVLPGLARELVDMAKKEQELRHTEITRVNKYEVTSGYWGMFISFIIFLVAIGVSGLLIYLGKSIEAVVALISTILVFAGIFIKGKNYKEEINK